MGNYQGYQKYKDSGVVWLGDIPEHWRVKRIKFLVNKIGSGKTPKGGSEVYIDSGIMLIRSQNVYDDGFRLDDVVYIDDEIDNIQANSRVFANDILLNITGASIGRVCLVPTDFQKANVNQHVCIFRPKLKEIFPQYLHLLFCSTQGKEQIFSYENGTSREGLNFQEAGNLTFAIPPLNEQQKIAQFLDYKTKQIDELIKKKETLIEKLDEKRTSLISHAVTKGLDSSVPMKDSGVEWLGEIPEHWEKSQLGYLAKVKARLGWKGLTAQEYVNDGYIFLATPNIKNEDYIDFQNVNYITSERYFESPEIMLEKNDILLVKDGSTLGIVNIVRELPSPSTVNSSIAVVRITKKLYSEFLFRWLTGLYIQSLIQLMKGGQGVPHLFQADIKKFFIVIPPFSEQKQIAEYLDQKTTQIDQQKAKIQEAIELLKEYRTSLITNAVTGKIDVSQIAIPSPQKPQPQKG
jgi:type I restriction enzyme S subunit